jgi:multidrug efflux pump subunit AcrA (membrane-fusion protein)
MVLAAILSSCALMPEETIIPPPIIPYMPVTYNTLAVSRGDVHDLLRTNGVVTPFESHEVGLDTIGGYVVAVFVNPGQEVYAGQVLMELDARDLRTQIEALQRDVELAAITHRSAVNNHNAAVRAHEALVVTTDRDMRLAEARWAQAREQYFIHNTITELAFMEAEASYLSTVERLERDLRQARDRAADDGERRRAQIALTIAEERLREMDAIAESFVLRSPIDGVLIYMRPTIIGQWIPTNQHLFIVADDSKWYITMSGHVARDFQMGADVFLEAQVRIRDPITGALTTARETVTFRGTVVSGSPEERFRAGIPEATAMIDVWEWPERVDRDARVTIYYVRAARYDVIAVPLNAVTEFGQYAFVRVLVDGAPIERQVELGVRSQTTVEILDGLSEGELIVAR